MPKITELFAFVCEETPGNEGVMGATMTLPDIGPTFTPLVGADMNRIESLRPIADHISKQTGVSYRLLKFTLSGEIK